jgi:hypothetical protein
VKNARLILLVDVKEGSEIDEQLLLRGLWKRGRVHRERGATTTVCDSKV